MEVTCSTETSIDFQQTTRPYIPEDIMLVIYPFLLLTSIVFSRISYNGIE
jgi:hypothetical protein